MTEDVENVEQETEETSAPNPTSTEETTEEVVNPYAEQAEETPEWFLKDKYKTVEDQAMAYPELAKKLGAFTGAPEKYEMQLSKELTELGVNLTLDDPMVEQFIDIAKEGEMNQETFNKLTNFYAEMGVATQKLEDERVETEMKQLGDNPQERIDKARNYMSKLLPQDMMPGAEDLLNTSGSVQALESLLARTRPGNMNPTETSQAGQMSEQELKDFQFAKDEFGNPKQQDPAYRKLVKQKYEEMYGTAPHNKIVG